MSEFGTVKKFKLGMASAQLLIWDDGTSRLSNVYSRDRGLGQATRLLEKIAAFADEQKLSIFLTVKRFGYADRKALTNAQLVEFYSKFGFEIVLDGEPIVVMMCRTNR